MPADSGPACYCKPGDVGQDVSGVVLSITDAIRSGAASGGLGGSRVPSHRGASRAATNAGIPTRRAGLGGGASDRPGKGRGLSRRGRTDRPLDPAATNLAASQPLQHAR